MAKRDFNVSNKEYIKKNKFAIMGVSLFLLIGIVIMAVFGFNGNFEFAGYNEVEVRVGLASTSTYASKIGNILNEYGGKYEGYQVAYDGENTTLIIRYLKSVAKDKQQAINDKIAALSNENINVIVLTQNGTETGHVKVGSIITAKDYLYTTLTILIIIIFATIFAYIRYNGASAMTLLLSCLLATIGLLCLTAILRITIGQSYFVLLAILNLLVAYGCINFFENIKETSWLQAGNYAKAVEDGLKKSHFRFCILSIAIFAVGLLFALIAPASIKYISLSILFVSVTMLAVMLYIMPFVWSMLITCKKPKKLDNTKIEK